MAARRAAAVALVLCHIEVLALAGCAGARFGAEDEHGLLWDPARRVGVPDWTREGWERRSIADADLAFHKPGSGWIAVRVRCASGDSRQSLRWEGRGLWLGIPREGLERRAREIDGRPALEMSASSQGLTLRTAVVRSGDCTLDAAQTAPEHSAEARESFDRFLAGIRLREVPS
jgi:hypothetical protein